jgi:hypothetical protein
LLWVSRKKERGMETRLIIAYSLIAMMAAIAILGCVIALRKRDTRRRRDAGRGDY